MCVVYIHIYICIYIYIFIYLFIYLFLNMYLYMYMGCLSVSKCLWNPQLMDCFGSSFSILLSDICRDTGTELHAQGASILKHSQESVGLLLIKVGIALAYSKGTSQQYVLE